MATQHDKGQALEYAVRRIEETVLAHDPAFAGAPAKIEQNKRIVVDGVRHEIDVWVVLNEGTNYATTHILECKNWKDPVGTDEVSKLAIKRDEVGAHTASLIATGFTADAERLAQKRRIKLSVVADFRLFEIAAPIISHKIEGGDVAITYARLDPSAPTTIGFSDTRCAIDGKPMELGAVLDSMIGSHLQETTQADPRCKLPGSHSGSTAFHHVLRPGRLYVEGFEVAVVAAEIVYTAEIQHPTISARFSVEGRGGFFKLEYPPGTMGYENVVLEIVTKPEPRSVK